MDIQEKLDNYQKVKKLTIGIHKSYVGSLQTELNLINEMLSDASNISMIEITGLNDRRHEIGNILSFLTMYHDE